MSERVRKYNEAFSEAVKEAQLLGHKLSSYSDGLCDYVSCSCGWKSECHWDGREFALDSWKKHVEALIPLGQVAMNF